MYGCTPSPRRRPLTLRLELLEDRATPAALSPAQVQHAYGFDQVAAVKGTKLTGAGETIAIVDAYNDPYIQSDLATFDRQWGLAAPPSFKVVSETGSTTALPRADSGWSGEIALDVEWAHAIAPGANILLVEANSSGTNDLLQAVNYARNQSGVVAVSMSWGGSEFNGETSYNSYFTTPAGHTGVAFVASSGDSGAGAIWPAVSTNVLGVGGTSLNLSSGNYGSESAWSGSGGGPSYFTAKPSWQTGNTSSSRGSPDVAYDANPNTGYYVYNTFDGGWEQIGGTSAGAPQWAALVALADQGRALQGHGSLDGGTQLLPAIYSMPASNFHDVATGSTGYAAKAGYDFATGRGSPVAQSVIGSLVGYGYTTTTAGTTSTSTGTTTTGTTTTSTGGTSSGGSSGGGGSTTGGGWWGWWWGWGWSFAGAFAQPATTEQPAPETATSAFTMETPHATTAAAPEVVVTTPQVTAAAEPSVVDQVNRPLSDTPWWAVQTSVSPPADATAEDDFAPIAV